MIEAITDSNTADSRPVSSVFIVGNSRSGTTLMARLIGGHPDVLFFPETHFFGGLWEPAGQDRPLSDEQAIRILSILLSRVRHGNYSLKTELSYRDEAVTILRDWSGDAWEVFLRFQRHLCRHAGKRIACEQTPKNLYYLDRIFQAYPESRAICMIRDPRDVLLSQRGRWRRRWLGTPATPFSEAFRAWANYHPVTTSKLWNSAADQIECYRDHRHCLLIRYEDLVADPTAVMTEVMQFIGVEFDSGQLSVPKGGSSEIPNIDDQFGIRPDRVGAWTKRKDARTELHICQSLCASRMRRYGYQIEPISYNVFLRLFKFITLPFQLALALMMNLGKWQDIGTAIRHRIRFRRVAE